MVTSHVRTWQVTESAGYESSWIELGERRLRARGRAVGTVPEPYWIAYELETAAEFVTRRLLVSVESADGSTELDLRRDGNGHWTANSTPLPDVEGALDCDLGLCPLTNTMPVLRHGLHRDPDPGPRDFLMAWVSVPDLGVRASYQTYTPLARTGRSARIRYTSGDYRSDVEFDEQGLVIRYPGMASRIFPAT